MSVMGEGDEVVQARIEGRVEGKLVHVIITNKTISYGPNGGDSNRFRKFKLPQREGVPTVIL